jgi:hypothetical protein
VSDRGEYQATGDTAWVPAEHFLPVPHGSAGLQTTPTSLGSEFSGEPSSSTEMLDSSVETGTPWQIQRPEFELGSARGAQPTIDAKIDTTSGPSWFMGVTQMRQAPGRSGSPVEGDRRISEQQVVLSKHRALLAARQSTGVSGFTGLGKRKELGKDTKASMPSSSASLDGASIKGLALIRLRPEDRIAIWSLSDARFLLSEGDIVLLGTAQIEAEFLRFRGDELVVRILHKSQSLANDQMLPQGEGRELMGGEVAVSLTDRVIPDKSRDTSLGPGQRSIKGVAVRLAARPVSNHWPFMKLLLPRDLPGFIGRMVCIGGEDVVGRIPARLLNVDLTRQLVAVLTDHYHSDFERLGYHHLLSKYIETRVSLRVPVLGGRIPDTEAAPPARRVSTWVKRRRLDATSSWFKERRGTFVFVLPLDQVKIATGLRINSSGTDLSVEAQLQTGDRAVMWDRLVEGTSNPVKNDSTFRIRVIRPQSNIDSSSLPPSQYGLIDPIFGFLPPKQETLLGCLDAQPGDVVRLGAENPIPLRIAEARVINGIGFIYVTKDQVIPPGLEPHVFRSEFLDSKGMIGIRLHAIKATFDEEPET